MRRDKGAKKLQNDSDEIRKRNLPQECAEKLSLDRFVALTEKLSSYG